jgi:hypothetical protein
MEDGGQEGGAGVESAAPLVVLRFVLSVSVDDDSAFMGLLKHGFEKATAHRGYKMQGQKRGL